jgi:hypothetical protein
VAWRLRMYSRGYSVCDSGQRSAGFVCLFVLTKTRDADTVDVGLPGQVISTAFMEGAEIEAAQDEEGLVAV